VGAHDSSNVNTIGKYPHITIGDIRIGGKVMQ
jgi:hypothetical protein